MGVLGAVIGAVGSIAGSAIGGALSGGGGGGGGSIPQVNLSGVTLDDPNQAGIQAFINQQAMWGPLSGFVNQVNTTATQAYTSLLNTLYPGATSQLGTVSSLANAYLQGNIPADVQAQIQRATAQQALAGGYPGTGMGTNLTARDIGQTSTELTQLGTNMYTTGLGAAASMIPGYLNPAQLLFSPSQLLSRTDQANYYNTDIKNQQQIINAQLKEGQQAVGMAQQQQGASQGGLFGGQLGSGLGKLFSGGLGSLFGGGDGGNNIVPAVGGGFTSPLFPSDTTSSASFAF